MSDFVSVLESLRRVYAEIGEAETVAQSVPGDRYVLANIASLKSHAAELEALWNDAARREQREVCRYRMIPMASARYSISAVTKSLLEFQRLFTRVYDSIASGKPKKGGRTAPNIITASQMELAFLFPGSLGVTLTVPGESRLFGDKFDVTLDALIQITTVDDDDEVRDLAKRLGEAVVSKAYDWAKANVASEFDIGLRWSGVRTPDKGGVIPLSHFEKLVEVIERTSDKIEDTIFVNGILNGIDVDKSRFNFFGGDDVSFAGDLDDDFDRSRKWSVPERYQAQIKVERVTEYATERDITAYRLMGLTDLSA